MSDTKTAVPTIDYEVTEGGVIIRVTDDQGLDLTTPYEDPDKIQANVAWARSTIAALVESAPGFIQELEAKGGVVIRVSDDEGLDLTTPFEEPARVAAYVAWYRALIEDLVRQAPAILLELEDLALEIGQRCDVCAGDKEVRVGRNQTARCDHCDVSGRIYPAIAAA
jgi:hypothetical protein